MKIFKSLLLSFLAFVVSISVFVFPASADSSIGIGSLDELIEMEKNPDANYHLTNNIVVETDDLFKPLFSATNQFKGVLDGKGYSIIGLDISSVKSTSGSSSYSGIFAYNAGTIKNLNVENATAICENSKYAYTGIIAAVNLGTIENCYVSGSSRNTDIGITAYTGGVCGEMLKGEVINTVSYANVYSSGGEQYTGGILGYTEKGTVKQCAAFGSVFSNGIDRTMDGYGGGIIGFSRAGTEITDCLFGGGVIVEKTSNSYLGGVSGLTYGKVKNFVSYGTLTPSEVISHIYIGGSAGEESNADVKNAYYLEGTINEEITGRKGKSLTKKQMSDQSSFVGFDFSGVWKFSDGVITLAGLPEPSKQDVTSELTGIKIDALPKKLDYVQGDPVLDLTGLKVSAVYTDKTVALEQSEYTVGGYNYVIAGKQTITVSYKGYTATFTVNVAKTTASIITPSDTTEGSYQEGNQNGKIPGKKPEDSASSKDNSSKTSSTTGTTGANSTASVVLGGNVVIDTLDDDQATASKDTQSTEAQLESSAELSSDETVSTSAKPDKVSPLLIVVLIVVALAVVAAVVIWLILKSKSQTPQNEVSNEELAEVEQDENDVYNK